MNTRQILGDFFPSFQWVKIWLLSHLILIRANNRVIVPMEEDNKRMRERNHAIVALTASEWTDPRSKQVVCHNYPRGITSQETVIPLEFYHLLKGMKNNSVIQGLKPSVWLCCLPTRHEKELCSHHIQIVTGSPELLSY